MMANKVIQTALWGNTIKWLKSKANRSTSQGQVISPDEVGAVTAEGGLLEEPCGELMALHLMDDLLA